MLAEIRNPRIRERNWLYLLLYFWEPVPFIPHGFSLCRVLFLFHHFTSRLLYPLLIINFTAFSACTSLLLSLLTNDTVNTLSINRVSRIFLSPRLVHEKWWTERWIIPNNREHFNIVVWHNRKQSTSVWF